MEIRISKEQLSTMGGNSLVGMVGRAGVGGKYAPSEELVILFEQTSTEWREKHGGAEEIIVPEYLPMCLCGDIVTLIQLGFTKIKIGEYTP